MKRRNKFNHPLSQDVIMEILIRLPFESILALKRVSKQWKNLINDPIFFRNYRYKSPALVSDSDSLYCLLIRHNNNKIAHHHPPFSMCRVTTESIRRSSSTISLDDYPLITSNGMACVRALNGDFVLYNLFTGASETVTNSVTRDRSACCGFGYDSYGDDYKILAARGNGFEDSTTYPEIKLGVGWSEPPDSLFWIYSKRSLVWKPLEGFPYTAYRWDPSWLSPHICSINGVLHWGTCTREDPSGKPVIVTYDLHTCRFGEISVPDGYAGLCANVSELEGQLCCWDQPFESEYRVWVMKEYGRSESWTVLLSLGWSRLSYYTVLWVAPVALYECGDGRKMLLLVCRCFGTLY